jgi:hypothetical protein
LAPKNPNAIPIRAAHSIPLESTPKAIIMGLGNSVSLLCNPDQQQGDNDAGYPDYE